MLSSSIVQEANALDAAILDNVVSRADTLEFKITHISPDDTPIGNQIWSIAESSAGWTFFAEESGITAQRGANWKSIKTEHSTTVRSLAIAKIGETETLYYGEQGDFGKVIIDSQGNFKAVSLKYLLDDNLEFGDVWNTFVIGDRVVFQTRMYIFILQNGSIRTLASQNGFHNSFVINSRFFVREFKVGLKELTEFENLNLVKGGEILAEEVIVGITSHNEREILIWGQSGSQYVQNSPEELIRKKIEYSKELKDIANQVRFYVIEYVGNSTFVIGTLGRGLIFVDDKAQIKFVLDKTNGFSDQSVNYILKSNKKGLWIALNNEGAMYADNDLMILSYSKSSGVSGYINRATYLNGELVLATGNGLYRSKTHHLNKEEKSHFYFTNSKINEFVHVYSGQAVWDIVNFKGKNVIAAESGVYILAEKQPASEEEIVEFEDWESTQCTIEEVGSNISTTAYVLYQIPKYDLLLVGTEKGLGKVNLGKENNCQIEKIESVGDIEIRTIVHEENDLWLGTAFNGIIRANLNQVVNGHQNIGITKSALHYPGRNDIVLWDKDVIAVNKSGIAKLSYDDEFGKIDLKDIIIDQFNSQENIAGASVFRNGKTWLVTTDVLMQIEKTNGRYKITSIPEALKFEKSSSSTVMEDENGTLWFNSGSTLFRYDESFDINGHRRPSIFIQGVVTNNDGNVLFSGNYSDEYGRFTEKSVGSKIEELDYEKRSISISLTSSDFLNPEAVQYRYMLEGSGRTWSEWNHESVKVFSTLKEGEYVFRAQAKDEVGRISEDVVYAFVILPPWFRTPWAYLGYLVAMINLMVSAQKYVVMRKAHKAAKEQAEELERNKVVVKKLQEANDRLLQANKLKDEFLATTSHELRTPLTAILGFTEVLKEEIPKEAEYREFLDIIEDSGLRLMDTLNSLLDLAKLRAGIVEITLEKVNLYEQSIAEVSKFQKMATLKGLELKVVQPSADLMVEADVHALGRIFYNLLSNAVKFTDRGSVQISFEAHPEKVIMNVTDTGIGIDEQFLPDLFDAFIQESDGLSRSHEGTGLGLAICAGLAILMNAGISVKSSKGQGSTFCVELPRVVEAREDRSAVAPGRPVRALGMGQGKSA